MAGLTDTSEGPGLAPRFLLVPAVADRIVEGFGLFEPRVSTSDVSGVSDWTEVFALNTGDTTVEGVVEADAADFARVLLLVWRAMSQQEMQKRKTGRGQRCQVVGGRGQGM